MTEYEMCLHSLSLAAKDHETLIADTLWPYLDHPPLIRNNVGKAFSEAARLGWIEGTERFVKSTRRAAKGRRVQVWRSLVFQSPGGPT